MRSARTWIRGTYIVENGNHGASSVGVWNPRGCAIANLDTNRARAARRVGNPMAHWVPDPKETPMTTPMTPANRGQKTKSQKAKSAVLCALVALNVLLVAILVTRHMPENRAMAAQVNAGDILAVPG